MGLVLYDPPAFHHHPASLTSFQLFLHPAPHCSAYVSFHSVCHSQCRCNQASVILPTGPPNGYALWHFYNGNHWCSTCCNSPHAALDCAINNVQPVADRVNSLLPSVPASHPLCAQHTPMPHHTPFGNHSDAGHSDAVGHSGTVG